MDFALSETQTELVGLTNKILSDRMTLTHLKETERSDDGFDRVDADELAKANLLGIAYPRTRADSASASSTSASCCGRPASSRRRYRSCRASCRARSSTVACYGLPDQLDTLAHIAEGSVITTVVIAEHGADVHEPYVTATPTGDGGYKLSGVKTTVPFVDVAVGMLVPARVAGTDDVVVLAVHAEGDGIVSERQVGQNYEHLFQVTFTDVDVPAGFVIGTQAQGREILEFMIERTQVAMCALISGVCVRGCASPRSRRSTASSSSARSARSKRCRSGWPMHTSTTRASS